MILMPSLHDLDYRHEHRAQAKGDKVLGRMRRNDEQEILSLDQRGETRDAKWHKKKPEYAPPIDASPGRDPGGRAHPKRKPYDCAKTKRCQPEARIRIEIPDEYNNIPNRIAPKNQTRRGEILKVANHWAAPRLAASADPLGDDGLRRVFLPGIRSAARAHFCSI